MMDKVKKKLGENYAHYYQKAFAGLLEKTS